MIKTTKPKPAKAPDRLDEEEVARLAGKRDYVTGVPYLFVMDFGWSIVGFYVKHSTPLTIVVAHANHFRNAKKDYGAMITEGADPDCEWRYEGETEVLYVPHILRSAEYHGEVPRGRIVAR